MNIKIIDKIQDFVKENGTAIDRALNRMAVDIERLSKTRVPVRKGFLKASGRHERMGFMNYRTIFNKEYAAYQEFGGDGRRVIKNYTTPGTGKFYLKSSGDEIKKNALNYIIQEGKRVKVL